MGRSGIIIAAIFGFAAVALGAFGAHGLDSVWRELPDYADRVRWWRLGVEYHMWHALFMLGINIFAVVASSFSDNPQIGTTEVLKKLRLSTWFAVAGIGFFSGSLYLMALTGIRVLGAITPIGGVAFLGAWLLLALAGQKFRR